MKMYRFLAIAVISVFTVLSVNGQTADEIIGNYVGAIGGKDVVKQIKSLITESNMSVMGMEIVSKSIILNGVGLKQEMEVMGSKNVTCVTDKGGWTINPMAGSTDPTDMPEAQYKTMKLQIVIGEPFLNYPTNGFKAVLVGKEAVNGSDAFKITMTSPDNTSSDYFIDSKTFYLVKTIQKAEMQGQEMTMTATFSDFRKADSGYVMAYKTDTNIADQYQMESKIVKVEFNTPVSPDIFDKTK